MIRPKIVAFFCTAAIVLTGCDVLMQLGNAYTMTQCSYSCRSVTQFTVAGVDLSKQLSPLDVLKITPMLTGVMTSVPMKITANIDITNPNTSEAGLQGLLYILSIDGVQFTAGEFADKVSVPALSTGAMALHIGFDMATLLSGSSKDAVVNIVKNLAGIGNTQSKIKLEIKPSFKIGNQVVNAPMYIPLEITL